MEGRNYFILFVIASLLLGFLSNTMYLPSMPIISNYFRTNANAMQLTVTSWFLGGVCLQLLLGPLSDQYGRKNVMLVSIGLLSFASLLCAFASSFIWFLCGRFLQGLATSGIMVSGYAAVHEAYNSAAKATKMLGIVGMCTALAPLLGPLAGGIFLHYFGWRINFEIICIFSIFAFIFISFLWTSKKAQGSVRNFIDGFLVTYKKLLLDKKFVCSVLCYSFMFCAGGAFMTGVAFIVVDVYGYSASAVGMVISPLLSIYMLCAGVTGHLIRWAKPKKIIYFAMFLVTLSMLVFIIQSSINNVSMAQLLVFVGSFYFALGIAGPHLNNLSLSCAASANKGSASAVLTTCMMLGCTIGSLAMSLTYNKTVFSLAVVMALSIFAAIVSLSAKGISLRRGCNDFT